MVFIFYFLLSLIPVLWTITVYILRKWKHIYRFCFVNVLLVALYFFLQFNSTLRIFKTDPMGLKNVFLFLYLIIFQTVSGFIFALYYKFKLSKNGNQQRTINKRD